MEKMVQDHEQRILTLERNYSEVKKEMTAVQTSQLEIKGTLLKESQEQKELINKQRKEQDALFKTLVDHTLGIRKNNSNKKWELALAIFGGGGLFYGVIEIIQRLL